jgi:hypothetical protein
MKPTTAVILVFLGAVLPLWLFAIWSAGFIRFGAEPAITERAPAFEQATARDRDTLSYCLLKNYSNRLNLISADPPPQPTNTERLRNRALHMVVDVSLHGANGSIVRVYKINGKPLAPMHRLAIESCIPEFGHPAAGDPRNREYYSGADRR